MGSFYLMPTLPPYQNTAQYSQAPQPGSASYLNSGDLGFFNLPVERTIGGYGNNIWSNPQPISTFDPGTGKQTDLPFNPFTQGAITGSGGFTPFLPDKIVYKSPTTHLGAVPGGGQATQTVNGQNVNIGANNYAAGASSATPRPFETSSGTVSQQQSAPMTGFQFGQAGQPGGSFMGGSMQNGAFYANQPSSLNPQPQAGLGTFKPWGNPALNALQNYRSQP